MPFPMSDTLAAFMDGRIYVIGPDGSSSESESKVVVVFNTGTQTWEAEVTTKSKAGMEIGSRWMFGYVVVMGGKMYMRDYGKSFVYEPKESKWEKDEVRCGVKLISRLILL